MPGFIAGVTNPMFQQRDTWWDLLCVLDLPNNTGAVYGVDDKRDEIGGVGGGGASSGGSIGGASTKASGGGGGGGSGAGTGKEGEGESLFLQADRQFVTAVLSGVNAKLGEGWVRQQFVDYTNMLVGFAQDKGTLVNVSRLHDKAKRVYDANVYRMGVIEASSDYKALPAYPWKWLPAEAAEPDGKAGEGLSAACVPASEAAEEPSPLAAAASLSIAVPPLPADPASARASPSPSATPPATPHSKDIDFILLKSYIRKLQYESGIDAASLESIYKHLEAMLVSEGALQGALVLMPESMEGVLPLAAGVLHPSPSVKLYATIILSRMLEHKSTCGAVAMLNQVVVGAFERCKKRILDGSLPQEIHAMKRERTTSPSANDDILSTTLQSLSSFIQQTWMMAEDDGEGDGGSDDDEDGANSVLNTSSTVHPFSHTIDELDLIP